MKLSSSKLPWLRETVSPIEIRTGYQDNRRSARTPQGQVVDRSNARPVRAARARLGLRASRSSGSLPREQKVPRRGRRLKGVRQIPGRHPSGMAGGPGVRPRRPAKAEYSRSRAAAGVVDAGVCRAFVASFPCCSYCWRWACGCESRRTSCGEENGAKRSRKSSSSSSGELLKNLAIGISIQIWSA